MTRQQRIVLVVCILASFVAFLDGSVVNVALPAIMKDLGGGLSVQQWVVDAYLISLGSLILIAGSLSDLFGRKKVLLAGLIGFALTSIMCAIAPSSGFLIAGRALQGVAGALLVPSSLALIMSTFSGSKQGKAIGTWTAWTGISFIVGPLLGGFLVDSVSWRLIFAINLLPIAVTLWLLRLIEQPERIESGTKIDTLGAILCSIGLASSVFALIEQPSHSWGDPLIYLSLVAGLVLLVAFIGYESKNTHAMLPLSLFKRRNFSVGNVATAAIYGGLSMSTFIIVIFLQQVSGYSAFEAGLSLIPITIIMFLLSPRFGALAGRYGPRFFMSVGPMIAGLGFLLLLWRVQNHAVYLSQLLPGLLAFGVGLSMTVAPLTAAILGDVDTRRAGIASAINNAVSRIAGLLMVAVVGVIIGTHLNLSGFRHTLLVTAILIIGGGIISAIGIQNPDRPKSPL